MANKEITRYYMINCIDKRFKSGTNNWKVRETELATYITILQHEKCIITDIKLIEEGK